MSTATAQTHIDAAYRKLGIKAPTTARRNNGLEALNNMLSNFNVSGLIVQALTTENFTLTVGDAEYTIGSGGDFDTVRPNRVIDAFIRDSSSFDYAVDVEMSIQEFNDIGDKTAEARPTRLYYTPEYPLGRIYLNYEPAAAETLYIETFKTITELAALSTTMSLPDEYKRFVVYNLALELAPEEKIKTQTLELVIAIANDSKKIIKRLNASFRGKSKANVDNQLLVTSHNKGNFNILTGS